MPKRELAACLHFKNNEGIISFLNIASRMEVKKIRNREKIYNFEFRKDEDLVFANCENGTIKIYDFEGLSIRRQLSGYEQTRFLMRMSCGGVNGKYLAVTSETGDVLVFNCDSGELVMTLKPRQKTVANCVAWID